MTPGSRGSGPKWEGGQEGSSIPPPEAVSGFSTIQGPRHYDGSGGTPTVSPRPLACLLIEEPLPPTKEGFPPSSGSGGPRSYRAAEDGGAGPGQQ